MQRSDQINELAAALAKAQGSISNSAKDCVGQSGNKRYKYSTLGAVFDACRDALSKNNLAVTQDADVQQAGVKITTMLLHSSGQFLSNEMILPISERSEKGIGMAITYGRRYALSAMVGVAPDEDDGKGPTTGGLRVSEPQVYEIRSLCQKMAIPDLVLSARLSRDFAASAPQELSMVQADDLLRQLRSELAQRGPGAQLTDERTPTAPSTPATATVPGSQKLQEALSADKQANDTARNGTPVNADQAWADCLAAFDSYFALKGLFDPDNEPNRAKRTELKRQMLAKRGVTPLLPAPPEVVRELTGTLERAVAELTEQRRIAGVTCAAQAVPAVPPAAKS